jgi:hypothetical protein
MLKIAMILSLVKRNIFHTLELKAQTPDTQKPPLKMEAQQLGALTAH